MKTKRLLKEGVIALAAFWGIMIPTAGSVHASEFEAERSLAESPAANTNDQSADYPRWEDSVPIQAETDGAITTRENEEGQNNESNSEDEDPTEATCREENLVMQDDPSDPEEHSLEEPALEDADTAAKEEFFSPECPAQEEGAFVPMDGLPPEEVVITEDETSRPNQDAMEAEGAASSENSAEEPSQEESVEPAAEIEARESDPSTADRPWEDASEEARTETAFFESQALYAQSSAKRYSIKYVLSGGVNAKGNPSSYAKQNKDLVLKAPSRKGYVFLGWYSDKAMKTRITSVRKGSTGNKVFYAKWTPAVYRIQFNGSGATDGSMAAMENLKYGSSYRLSECAYALKGSRFVGWRSGKGGKGRLYRDCSEVKSLGTRQGETVTLFAEWKKFSEKDVYNAILAGVVQKKGLHYTKGAYPGKDDYIDLSSFGFRTSDWDQLARIYTSVYLDHPECFYLDGSLLPFTPKAYRVRGIVPGYHGFANGSDLDMMKKEMEDASREAVKAAKKAQDPVAKALVLYEFLAVRNSYDWNAAAGETEKLDRMALTAYSAIVDRGAEAGTVCKGMAFGFKYLADKVDDPGLEAKVVPSEAMEHVWNMVRIRDGREGGHWYHLDVNRAINAAPTVRGGFARYNAFLLSDKAMEGQGYHGWKDSEYVSFPDCTSGAFENLSCAKHVYFPVHYDQKTRKCMYIKWINGEFWLCKSGARSGSYSKLKRLEPYDCRLGGADGIKFGSGAAWRDAGGGKLRLYYVNKSKELVSLDARTLEETPLLSVKFSPSPSKDGRYQEEKDGIGVAVEGGKVTLWSATRREMIATATAR